MDVLPRAWLTVGLLWVVGFLNYMDRVMITTMRGSIKDAIPMTEAQFGLLTTLFLVIYGALSPLGGFLADRFNRSRLIFVSLFVWSVVTWLTGHAKTYDQLLLTRALMGVSEACYIPAALALIMDFHHGPTRSMATGVHLSGVLAGSALGGVGGWLAERYDWAFAFRLFGAIGTFYALVIFFLLRNPEGSDTTRVAAAAGPGRVRFISAVVSLMRTRAFVLALCFWSLLGAGGWALTGWMPTYLKERFHMTQGAAGLSATGYANFSALVGILIGGYWADRWSRTNPRARILVPVIGMAIAAPAVLLTSTTSILPIALAALVCYGLARAFADANMMPILCVICDARYRATGYGVLNFFSCTVGGFMIYVGGALRDADVDISRVFQFGALAIAGCAAILYLVRPLPMKSPNPI